jgi:hypothetical protein
MPEKKSHARAPGKTSLTISLTDEFRDEIDAAAREENRTRSNFIVTLLAKKLAERKARLALDNAAPKPATFPSTARPPQEIHSVNESAPTADAVPPTRSTTPAQPDITKTRRGIRGMIAKEKGKA